MLCRPGPRAMGSDHLGPSTSSASDAPAVTFKAHRLGPPHGLSPALRYNILTVALVLANVLTNAQPSASSLVAENSTFLAQALATQACTEIILDPSGVGNGGGLLELQRDDFPIDNATTLAPGRYLTIRSVNGNPTMMDLARLPFVLQIGNGSSLELRDLLIRNYAQAAAANSSYQYDYVSGMLSWPSFTAQPGGALKLANTTQYFWSSTVFRRPDCPLQPTNAIRAEEEVSVQRGGVDFKKIQNGVVQQTETGLYMAFYPVFARPSLTKVGQLRVDSENSFGICIPDNSSYNVISDLLATGAAAASTARAGGSSSSSMGRVSVLGLAIGVSLGGLLLIALVLGLAANLILGRRRERRLAAACSGSEKPAVGGGGELSVGGGSAQLPEADSGLRGPTGGFSDTMSAPAGSRAAIDSADILLEHFAAGRMRRMGPSDEEQVEFGPLLGRGSFGRVYKGRWKNVLVAIKVVENTAVVGAEKVAEQRMAREALLATNLAHPNIIATFKICTVRSGGRDKPSGAGGSANTQTSGISTSKGDSAGELPRGAKTAPAPPPTDTSSSPQSSQHSMMGSSNNAARRRGGTAGLPPSVPEKDKDSAELNGGRSPNEGLGEKLPEGGGGGGNGSGSGLGPGSRPGPGAGPELTVAEEEDDALEERKARLVETWMLMEYCERGSLADALRTGRLRRPPGTGLPELAALVACLLDIAQGMEYLHDAGILHGDLKPANVLLKATSADRRGFTCKVCDFGMSRLLDPTQHTHVSTQTYGTMPYMPPELIAHARFTRATDVYSFGILMWELFVAEPPFGNMNLGQLFFAVVHEHKRPPLDAMETAKSQYSPDERAMLEAYIGVMERCWAREVGDRPMFAAVVRDLNGLMRRMPRQLSNRASAPAALDQAAQAAARNRAGGTTSPQRNPMGPTITDMALPRSP